MTPKPRRLKKGEVLFREGEEVQFLYILQSGKMSCYLSRQNTRLELMQLSAPALLGEQVLFASSKFGFEAEAKSESMLLEIPLVAARSLFENLPQLIKMILKGLSEQYQESTSELKALKLDQDPTPCPPELVPRLFGGIFHFIHHFGEQVKPEVSTRGEDTESIVKEKIRVSYPQMKQYCSRIFNIPQEKLEAVLSILKKMNRAELIYEKLEDDPQLPPQLSKINFTEHTIIEQFFEYYQHYYYKSGKQDFLKPEESVFFLTKALVEESVDLPIDRSGNVMFKMNDLLLTLKNKFFINVSASTWQLLEQKGLFSKKFQHSDGEFYIQFPKGDFQIAYEAWRFIREINKWNQRGKVNADESEFPLLNQKASEGTSLCSSCQAPYIEKQNFCGNCGAKINQQAA